MEREIGRAVARSTGGWSLVTFPNRRRGWRYAGANATSRTRSSMPTRDGPDRVRALLDAGAYACSSFACVDSYDHA
jgi:hypothetical protein